jgi:hypothetical protein
VTLSRRKDRTRTYMHTTVRRCEVSVRCQWMMSAADVCSLSTSQFGETAFETVNQKFVGGSEIFTLSSSKTCPRHHHFHTLLICMQIILFTRLSLYRTIWSVLHDPYSVSFMLKDSYCVSLFIVYVDHRMKRCLLAVCFWQVHFER